MAQFEYWMTTDLTRGSSQVQVLHGQTFTQDNLGNRVGVVVLDGGEPATLSGTVTGYVIRADGGTVVVVGATDGNRAYIDLPESAYAVPGQIQIAIRLVSGDAKTVLGAMSAYVQRTATGTIIDPGHVVPDIDDLLAQIERMEQGTAAAEEAAENAVAAVGAPFDETADYVYGDYVTHNGALYMAAEDITAGSPFTPGQWQKINVMDTVGTAVLYTPQALSSAQGLQAANNIGALTKGWGQTLTADQQQAVRDKIGLPFIDWDTNWTDAQKAQARKNLNAADIGNAKTPEMYGAKGDGVTDDGNALLSAFSEASAAGVPLVFTYGKTYAIGRFVQMTGHRINVYGNGATIKVLTGTATLNEVLYISDDNDGQFPDSNGKGLIENLTIDCNGLAKCGIHIVMAKGYELQNLDICGFTEKGLFITSGFEIFCHNIRIAGSGIAGSVGLFMNTSDSRFVNIVTKNVAVGIENHGAANYYTHVHAWNTLAAIAPTSIMFDSYADLHASDCYVDTCAIGIYQHSDDAVEVNGLTIVDGGSLMSNTPTVFKLTDLSYAARIHGTGMVYLSDADYNMFEADVSQYAKDYDWLGNNDSSTHGMGNMPNAYAITEEIADLKSAISDIIDAPENVIDYNQSNFKQFTNYTGTYTANSDGFTFSKGESANYQIGLFFPVIVGHAYRLSYHVSSGASAQSYVMRNGDYPNKLSVYTPEYAYNDNYASESGNDYAVNFTAVTNPECVLAFRISYSAPTDFTLTDLICIDTTENVKVKPEALPFATNVNRGAVVVGNGLSISGEGVLSIDSSITQEINEIETDVDLIETVAVQKVYPVNVLDVSSESFGRSKSGQNWDNALSITYNENNGFRATLSEYLNLRWWYLFNTQSGKTYDVSCETSGMNSGCTLKIMKNYNTPASPDEYSEDYVVATLTDDGDGKYTGSFTADSGQYVFVIYKRYDSRDLTVTNVKCTDQADVERYEMKIADSGSVGGIRIGSGLSITENGIMSVDKAANIPTKYDGREFCVFNKCLCIGDSLTQGVFNHNEGGSNQTVVISKYSYPSILAKMSGVETTNLGNGGYTSEEWYALHENDDLSGHDVCIISLGTNDAAKGLNSGTTQSWIQAIITKVKTQNTGIMIFVSNLLPAMKYNTQAYTDVNNYISAVVQANTNCYLLDMTQYSACQRGTPYAQEHLTAIGYRQEAEEIMNYIGYIMQGNKSDFRNVQFAGTNYDWDDD